MNVFTRADVEAHVNLILGNLVEHLRGPGRREHLEHARPGFLLVRPDEGVGSARGCEVVLVVAHASGSAEAPRVGVEADAVLARHPEANLEALVRHRGVEVEDEEQWAALGDDHLALLASHGHELVFVRHEAVLLLELHKRLVEIVEFKVAEVLGVR